MNKYARWHDQIIARARGRKLDCYKERHHIVPRSCGGLDAPENLVDLTYREHFLVHWLLTKIYTGRQRAKMIYALKAMIMPLCGRVGASWRIDLAKRVIKDHSLSVRRKRMWAKIEARKAKPLPAKELKAREELAGYYRMFKSWKDAGLGLTFIGVPDGGRLAEEYFSILGRMLAVPA